jgi:cytochrome c
MRPKTGMSIISGTACLLVMAGSAFAQQGLASRERGQGLAARLCINCHIIDRDTSGGMRTDVPSFPAIAKRPGVTAERLAGSIIIPHPAMPDASLTAGEIRDIVAYILSLKLND